MSSSTKLTLMLGALVGCAGEGPLERQPDPSPWTDDALKRIDRMRFDPTVPADPSNAVANNPDAAALGQFLFYSPLLSLDGTVSCASCHQPDNGFADVEPYSDTLGPAGRHTPSIWNTANNDWFFWDGRADTQWSQALGPLENPVEHGANRVGLLRAIGEQPDVVAAWSTVFGGFPDVSDAARFPDATPLVEGNLGDAWLTMTPGDQTTVNTAFAQLGKAISAYERQLMTGPTRFDDFAEALGAQQPDADQWLTESERRGLELFVGEANCHLCHFGPDLSNESFHNIGLDGDADSGRFAGVLSLADDPFNAAGDFSDDRDWGQARLARLATAPPAPETLGQFKVPSLRGVGQTAPYFHDGGRETLEDVVRYYSRDLTNPVVGHREESLVVLDLSDEDESAIVDFLRSLDVPELPQHLRVAPAGPRPVR